MTIGDAARYYGLPESTLRAMLEAKLLPGRRIDGDWDINHGLLQTALTLLGSLSHSVGGGGVRPGVDSPALKPPPAVTRPPVARETPPAAIQRPPAAEPPPAPRRRAHGDRDRAQAVWDEFREAVGIPKDSAVDVWAMALRQARTRKQSQPQSGPFDRPPPRKPRNPSSSSDDPYQWH